jgi:hypothetical protein
MLLQDPQERPVDLPPSIGENQVLLSFENQMVGFAAEHEDLIRQIRTRYIIADTSVLEFLRGHRTLPPLLVQAIPYIDECFGASAVFSLRAPLDEWGAQTLYAVAMWPGEISDVRTALERFDERWWIASARQAAGNLTFTYELV